MVSILIVDFSAALLLDRIAPQPRASPSPPHLSQFRAHTSALVELDHGPEHAGAHPHAASCSCEPDKVERNDPVSGEITDRWNLTWSAQQDAEEIKTANIYLAVAGSIVFGRPR